MVISKHILTDYINNHDMMWLIMMRNESKRWYIILLILDGKEYYSLVIWIINITDWIIEFWNWDWLAKYRNNYFFSYLYFSYFYYWLKLIYYEFTHVTYTLSLCSVLEWLLLKIASQSIYLCIGRKLTVLQYPSRPVVSTTMLQLLSNSYCSTATMLPLFNCNTPSPW